MPYAIVSFNGINLADNTNYILSKLDGIYKIPIRVSQEDITYGDGGNIWSRQYGIRVITIEGEVTGSTASSFLNAMHNLMVASSIKFDIIPLTITLWDGRSKTINVKVTENPDVPLDEGMVTYADYRMVLSAENPFFQDIVIQTYTVFLSHGGGTRVPTRVPLSLSFGSGGSIVVNNSGDISSYPQFYITGAITNATITNTTTGQSFSINTSLTDGQTVTVSFDSKGLYCTLQDGSNYMPYLIGSIFPIIQGNNTIVFSGSSHDALASLKITVNNQYFSL